MPIEVGIGKNAEAGPAIEVAHLTDQHHQVFTFPLRHGARERRALDPNAWVMMKATFGKQ